MALTMLDRHPRIEPVMTVIIQSGGRGSLARARELSLTGCFVEAVELPVDGRVFVELPIGGDLIGSECRVVRMESRADGLFNVALSFQDMAWEDICALAKYVAPKTD